MDELGEKTFTGIGEAVTDILKGYQEPINVAYGKADGKLKLNLTLDIDPHPEGNHCVIGLSFVKERVKDSVTRIIKERQMELFDGGQS